MKKLIAIDWGTTSLRAALLDEQGNVHEERASPQGILTVPPGGFPPAFNAICKGWHTDDTLTLMSGMVGSRQGWMEAPYCPCPAGFDDIARQLAWVEPGRVAIVPGMSCERDGVPDVMRGEEVQVFGALQLLGLSDATVVLPGTHSKWVTVRSGRIESFATWMTGEFYALLRQHSILSRTLPAHDGEFDIAAFDQGIDRALQTASLLGSAFSARTLSLFEQLPAAALPSYLSGLVIGEELRAQAPQTSFVVVMGSAALTQRYDRALAHCGIATQHVGAQATWQGLWAIAQTLKDTP
jgi:2-dehydro-3-deoxygalactonokinase